MSNEHVILSFDYAPHQDRNIVEYNRQSPHSSLGNLAPEEFAAKNQMSSALARAAWPAADLELAGAAQRAPASDPELGSFSATLRSV